MSQAGTIRFSCSNGHPIVVPAKLAGKRGACSRCGVAVLIPATSDQEPGAEPGLASSAGPAEPVAEPALESIGGAVPGENEPGNVPDFSALGAAADGEQADSPPADVFEGLADAVSESNPPSFAGIEVATAEMDGTDNPTAVLVAKLFGETEHGGVVELHLKSGQIVMPLFYDFNWSRGTHGVFAAENPSDKTVTLMAVAWESVEQVIIRKVKGLPEGMFD